MALNLTVTEGTLNGPLVYTMVIQTHSTFSLEDQSSFENICWVFISWMNLAFEINTCFHQGMDGYQCTWIQSFYSGNYSIVDPKVHLLRETIWKK